MSEQRSRLRALATSAADLRDALTALLAPESTKPGVPRSVWESEATVAQTPEDSTP